MVIQNAYPNLSNIVPTDFELGRVMYTVIAADLGVTGVVGGVGGKSCSEVRVAGRAGLNG